MFYATDIKHESKPFRYAETKTINNNTNNRMSLVYLHFSAVINLINTYSMQRINYCCLWS